MTPLALLVFVTVLIVLLFRGVQTATKQAWHLTDVHIDIYYAEGTVPDHGCYCAGSPACTVPCGQPSNASNGTKTQTGPCQGFPCSAGPEHLAIVPCCHSGANMPSASICGRAAALKNGTPAGMAGHFGHSEGNCATPKVLFESALEFMLRQAPHADRIVFTGDFGQAGYANHNQTLGVMKYSTGLLRQRFPRAKVLHCLGNHDATPSGDVFTGTQDMAWLYSPLSTQIWQPELDPVAQASTLKGGWYSVLAGQKLRVIGLNTNYWATTNKGQLSTPTSDASRLGVEQWAWYSSVLAAAEASGEKVWVLAHIPPEFWMPGARQRQAELLSKHTGVVTAQLYGHVHTDYFELTRECRVIPPRDPGNFTWRKTTGIKWCSGGGDFHPNLNSSGVFGAGTDDGTATGCPLLPKAWSDSQRVASCEQVCAHATSCVGFTYYRMANNDTTACCFRTGSVANKPADPQSTARCYEITAGRGGSVCDGAVTGVILPGPSLTEGWPPMNPGVRLITYDDQTHQLLKLETWTADLMAANVAGQDLDWKLEYDTASEYHMQDLSAGSFASLVRRPLRPFWRPF
eukprot:COSAG01_NODE_3512_length_5986_cov_3.098182_5_plen_573_part_00